MEDICLKDNDQENAICSLCPKMSAATEPAKKLKKEHTYDNWMLVKKISS